MEEWRVIGLIATLPHSRLWDREVGGYDVGEGPPRIKERVMADRKDMPQFWCEWRLLSVFD